MPVQTRRRKASTESAHDAPHAKKQKATKPKTAPKTAYEDVDMVDSPVLQAHRKSFQATLDKLVHVSTRKVLKKPTKRQPHQDPLRATARAAISKSIRRVRGVVDDKELKPANVKAVEKVSGVKQKVGVEVIKKAVVKQVETLGEKIQTSVLKKTSKATSLRAASGIKVDTKEAKKRAEMELQMLSGRVSPNKTVKPSLIKKRVKGREERQQVHAAILKHAQLKELKQRGAK